MNLNVQIRALGFYLIACSTYQIAIYMRPNGMASILDARIGLFLLLGGETLATRIDWASAVWLTYVGLGLALHASRLLLWTYLLSECFLALSTDLYIVASLAGGAGYVTATATPLAILFGVMIGFTLVPLTFAVYLLRKKA